MLDILASYPCMQFQGKSKLNKMVKKPHFGSDLGPLVPNSGSQFFFFKDFALSVTRYHHVQYQKLLTIRSCENLVTNGQTDKETFGRQ